MMKSLIRSAAAGMSLLATSWAIEGPAVDPVIAPASTGTPSWSLVYLPDLDWTVAETKQTLDLLKQLKPDLVVSMNPCPFADEIRGLESKPAVLDQNQRAKQGVACGLPVISSSPYDDSSTLHSFGREGAASAGLVWLSMETRKRLFNGPLEDNQELRSLARMQIRQQLAERHGEMIFLVDPSVPTPAESTWKLPNQGALYEQATTAVTGFTCIRPQALQTDVAAIGGTLPRLPVIHWIHSGAAGMEWETLPIDGGPAIHHSTAAGNREFSDLHGTSIAWLKTPSAPLEVPLWMDDYISNNAALNSGDVRKAGTMKRRFSWTNQGVTRDGFQVLRAGENFAGEEKLKLFDLPHGAVRSPGKLFSITVGQLGETGWYPEDGDDGVNVYLDDLRINRDKSYLLYFAGIVDAWPAAATWFTDRYVITSGTGNSSDPIVLASRSYTLDDAESAYLTPQISAQTIRLFDLQSGRSFVAASIARDDHARPNAPTERIYFPQGPNFASEWGWKTLWKAVEAGYRTNALSSPFTADEVAAFAKLPHDSELQWKDLGIWPPPENWRLGPENKQEFGNYRAPKPTPGGDPFLTYTEIGGGQRRYTIAIAGYENQGHFEEQSAVSQVVAHADLFTTGDGSLPQLETIQRMGDAKRYLVLAGTYQKPAGTNTGKGSWMLLIDLLQHRSWSAHW